MVNTFKGVYIDPDAVQKGHELDFEPDGAELPDEDHHQKEKQAAEKGSAEKKN